MTNHASDNPSSDGSGSLPRLTVSVIEAAAMLGIGRGTAYECVRTGEIPSVRLGGRIVIPIHTLEELIGFNKPDAA